MDLPPELLRAASEGGGRIVLVIGAGCSHEPPTGLDLAPRCAARVHQKLVADRVLLPGDCDQPEDLERVTDAVKQKTNSKTAVVRRMPRDAYMRAAPNVGHKVLVALLQELAVGSVLTINFDLALDNAMTLQGANGIASIKKAEEHQDLGAVSLIYLHGNVTSPDDEWILTSDEVENSWEGGWRDIVTARVLTAPVVVFAGMGTLVGVLLDSVRRVRKAIPEGVLVFQVDPAPRESSSVFRELALPENHYVQGGWCEFAEALGARVNTEHLDELRRECESLDAGGAELTALLDDLSRKGLLAFGQIRASWFLERGAYVPWIESRPRWLAQVVTGVLEVAARVGATVSVDSSGVLCFELEGGRHLRVGCIHGRAEIRAGELDARVAQLERYGILQQQGVAGFITTAMSGRARRDLSPPLELTRDVRADDLVVGTGGRPRFVDLDDLLEDPDLLLGVAV